MCLTCHRPLCRGGHSIGCELSSPCTSLLIRPLLLWQALLTFGCVSEATMAVEGKLPAVPETILKRRKRQVENRALRAKEAVKSKVGY